MSTRNIENIPSWQYYAGMAKLPYPSETQDRYIVRFPEGMRDKIAETAKANGRSMNAEIVARLQSSYITDDEHKAKEDAQLDELFLARLDARLDAMLERKYGKIIRTGGIINNAMNKPDEEKPEE